MPTLYAALDDRVLVVRGQRRSHCAQGTQWDSTERLRGHDIECLAATSERPERPFVGTVDAGLKRSTDGGDSWQTVGDFSDRVTAVTVSSHDPAEVWVGTEPSAVYRSTDGGASFERREGLTDLPGASRWSFPPRPHTHHVRSIAVHPEDPERLYVAIEAGALVRTTDGGDSWQPHPEGAPRDSHTLATRPGAADHVYAAAGDGYAESTDCGDSWRYPQDGLDCRYVWGLAVDRETVLVSAANGPGSAHDPARAESYVYRKTGSGGWEQATEGLPDPEGTVRAVLAAGNDTGEFVALTNRGLFRTHDGGRDWHGLAVPWKSDRQIGRGLAVV